MEKETKNELKKITALLVVFSLVAVGVYYLSYKRFEERGVKPSFLLPPIEVTIYEKDRLKESDELEYTVRDIFDNKIESEEGVYTIYARETNRQFNIKVFPKIGEIFNLEIFNARSQRVYTASFPILKGEIPIDLSLSISKRYRVVLSIQNQLGEISTSEEFTILFKEPKNIVYKLKNTTQREPSTIVGKILKLDIKFPEGVNKLYTTVRYEDEEGQTWRYLYSIEEIEKALQLPEEDNPDIYSYRIQIHSYHGEYFEEVWIHTTSEEFYKENWCYYNYKTCKGIFYSMLGLIFLIGIYFGWRYYGRKHKELEIEK